MKSLRSLVSVFVIATGLLCTALSAHPSHAAVTDDASKYVQDMGNQALGVISNKNLSKDQKQLKLQDLFASSVDFQWVGRFVMGRYWRQATDAQKIRYLSEYQKFLLLNYTSRFTNYTSGAFKVTASRDDGDDELTVSTQMQAGDTPNSEPVLVDYRIRKNGNSFKIFDVIVEGVSLLTTQRSEFSSVINDKGIDFLINELATKAASDTSSRQSKS